MEYGVDVLGVTDRIAVFAFSPMSWSSQLNEIEKETEKVGRKLLIAGDQMPIDSDRLLRRVAHGTFFRQYDQLLDKHY